MFSWFLINKLAKKKRKFEILVHLTKIRGRFGGFIFVGGGGGGGEKGRCYYRKAFYV